MASAYGWKVGLIVVGLFMWITSTLMMHEIISPPNTHVSFVNNNHYQHEPIDEISALSSLEQQAMLRGRGGGGSVLSNTPLLVDQQSKVILSSPTVPTSRKLTPDKIVPYNSASEATAVDKPAVMPPLQQQLQQEPSPPLPPPSVPNDSSGEVAMLSVERKEDTEDPLIKKFSKVATGCDMVENIDYPIAPNGREMMVENLSVEDCCARCQQMNCDVAVISSESDSPPLACWIKSRVMKQQPIYKNGVKSCIRTSTSASSIGISEEVMSDYYPYIKETYKSSSSDSSGGVGSSKEYSFSALAGLSLGSAFTNSGNGVYEDTREESDPAKLSILNSRCDAIRGALMHCWKSYKEHAWGMDNVNPLSGRGSNAGFNHAVTMVDTLDTLWLMGLKSEFNEAKEWLRRNMRERIGHIGGSVSLFETTIRSFGGLLAAYDMSKDPVFKDLALLLGSKISSRTSSEGVSPYKFGGGAGGMGCPSLAESGTMQVEMNFLSKITGDMSFADKANSFYRTVQKKPSLDGLWPNCWQRGRGRITFGADGDSFYEYLIKGWLQTGKRDDNLWNMYNKAIDGMEKWLVTKAPDGLTYLNNFDFDGGKGGRPDVAMEHLACFVPGWLALGIPHQVDEVRRARHLKLAEELAFTCYRMYEAQPSGIGPERVKRLRIDLSQTDTKEYILRPEAIEGWWYMYELTGNDMYREWGWKTFLNFEKYLKAPHGYASLKNVRSPSSGKMDRMESFFLAETLKYLYLLQDPTRPIKLDTHVFNTEAHPFTIA